MNRTVRPLSAAAALLLVAAALTGCTVRPPAAPAAGGTAQPAAATRFTCPSAEEVAALTAVPLTARSTDSDRCEYTTATDATDATTVRLIRPATTAASLATPRLAALQRGERTVDLPALGFDAFTAASSKECTAWFAAADGVLSSVTARRSGDAGAAVCDLATAVAALAGTGAPGGAAPTVAVVASDRLLGTSTADQSWPWRIGASLGARIDRLTGTGYLRPSGADSLAARAASIPKDSAAVVFVSGTAEGGASRLEVLSATTAALSAAAARAPRARLVVVGPVAGPSADPAEVEDLRVELRSAAAIAGARYVEPGGGTGSAADLRAVAASISTTLAAAGVGDG